jgi:hypothetical protein
MVLVNRPERHAPSEGRARWLDWLAGLVSSNQLIVAAEVPAA